MDLMCWQQKGFACGCANWCQVELVRERTASLLDESVYRGAPPLKEERGGRSAVNM